VYCQGLSQEHANVPRFTIIRLGRDQKMNSTKTTRYALSQVLAGAAATVIALAYIESSRRAGTPVPVPFLVLYAGVVLAAWLGGIRTSLPVATLVAGYIIYAGTVPFGPATLTGGVLQISIGIALYGFTAILLGRSTDRLRRALDEQQYTQTISQAAVQTQERVVADLMRLIDRANAPIFGIDAAGNINEWNQTAERITGYSKHEVLGKDLVNEYITAEFKAPVKEVLDKALEGEETANYQFPLYTKANDRVDVLLNSTTRRDAYERIIGVVGVGQDITELNKVRLEQERVAYDLVTLIDTANAPIFGIDAGGNINEWNQTAERITGYSKHEVLGKDLVNEYITAEFKAPVKEVLDKALEGDETANYQFPLYTKAGDRVDVLLNSTTRRDAYDRIIGVVGVGQDITELNKVRVEQERVAYDLVTLIDTANAPIFGIDAGGKINEWNQTAERITGYAKHEVLGKDLVNEYITAEFKAPVKEVLDKALEGEETANYQFPLYTKANDRVDVLLNSTTRRDAYDRIIGVVGVGQDITELKKSEVYLTEARDKAEVANQAKSDFFATMSHEIRTPLNGVLGMLGILSSTTLTKDQLHYVESSRTSGESLLRIINDILDFSTMEAGQLPLEVGVFKIRPMVQSVIDTMSATIPINKPLHLTMSIESTVPEVVSGDAGRVRQILFNLVGNAVKFTEAGEVMVRLSSAGYNLDREIIRFEVEDTGPGIPEEARSTLFAQFTQIRNPLGVHPGGTGLCLAISKQLTETMNGDIGFSSIPRQGTIFWFELPFETNATGEPEMSKVSVSNVADQQTPHDAITSLNRTARILLAEDNPINSEVAKIMLEKEGYHVDIVGDGAEAVTAATVLPYDLVLMDLSMPVLDGLEASCQIRSIPSDFASVPIIAMTAHVMKDERATLASAGINGFIPKPFTKEEMMATVDLWIGRATYTTPVNRALSPRSATDLVDYTAIVKLADDIEVSFVPKLVESFVDDVERRLDLLEKAHAKGDWETIRFESHALKGSSALFGANLLYEKAVTLESDSLDLDIENSKRLTESLVATGRKTVLLLRRYIKNWVGLKSKES
jgi:PAS domain S-box-containing protein